MFHLVDTCKADPVDPSHFDSEYPCPWVYVIGPNVTLGVGHNALPLVGGGLITGERRRIL